MEKKDIQEMTSTTGRLRLLNVFNLNVHTNGDDDDNEDDDDDDDIAAHDGS